LYISGFLALAFLAECAFAETKICSDGEVHGQMDVRDIAIRYDGASFSMAIGNLGSFGYKISLSPSQIQQVATETQRANEYSKLLILSYNNCVITKQDFIELLSRMYPWHGGDSFEPDRLLAALLKRPCRNASDRRLLVDIAHALKETHRILLAMERAPQDPAHFQGSPVTLSSGFFGSQYTNIVSGNLTPVYNSGMLATSNLYQSLQPIGSGIAFSGDVRVPSGLAVGGANAGNAPFTTLSNAGILTTGLYQNLQLTGGSIALATSPSNVLVPSAFDLDGANIGKGVVTTSSNSWITTDLYQNLSLTTGSLALSTFSSNTFVPSGIAVSATTFGNRSLTMVSNSGVIAIDVRNSSALDPGIVFSAVGSGRYEFSALGSELIGQPKISETKVLPLCNQTVLPTTGLLSALPTDLPCSYSGSIVSATPKLEREQ